MDYQNLFNTQYVNQDDESKKKEQSDLMKDYKDCLNYIINFNMYNPDDLSDWADGRYRNWILKNEKYVFSATGGGIPARNKMERAQNKLYNLKTTFEKIAIINDFKLEQ